MYCFHFNINENLTRSTIEYLIQIWISNFSLRDFLYDKVFLVKTKLSEHTMYVNQSVQ